MAEDFGIRIKVDPNDAASAISSVQKQLDGLEQKGPAAGKALSDGMRQGGAAAKSTAAELRETEVAAERTGTAFKGMGNGIRSLLAMQTGQLTTLFSSGTLATAAFAGAAAATVKLADDYEQLRNTALRLSGTEDTVNVTMQRQLSLAGDLHAGLEQTMELSAQIKQHTESLNLSIADQNQLTKTLGEMSVLSGHSMSDATTIIQRLGFAFEEGVPAGRELKFTLREFPQLADAMKQHFHMTGAELVEAANKGQISFQDFFQSILDGSAKTEQAWNQRTETMGEHWQHFKDTVTSNSPSLIAHLVGFANAETDLQQGIALAYQAEAQETETLKKQTEAVDEAYESVEHYVQAHSDLGDAIDHTVAAMNAAKKLLDGNDDKFQSAADNVRTYAAAVGAIREKLSEYAAHGAKNPEALLSASDVAVLRGYRDAQEEFLDQSSRYGGVIADIHKQEAERMRGIEDLRGALRDGEITQDEYTEAMKKYKTELTDTEKYLQGLTKPMDELLKHQDALDAAYYAGRVPLAAYTAESERLAEALEKLNGEQAQFQLKALLRQYPGLSGIASDVASPLSTGLTLAYRRTSDVLTARPGIGERKDAAAEAEAQKKAIEDYKQQVKSTAEQVQHAFDPVNSAIMKGIVEGKAGWADLGKSMLEQLGEAILKALELKAIMSMMPAPPTGGTMPSLGGIGSALSFLGLAQGGDLFVPRAAQGYSGVVGGAGGTDSKLAMLRVTPGETISVRTPGQMQQMAQARHQPVSVKIVNVHDRESAASEIAQTDAFEQGVLNVLGSNPNAVRGLVAKR